MNVATLEGKELDYWMYKHACEVLENNGTKEEFESGYADGRFHFCEDKALLPDLLETYTINLQRLAGEWLASTSGHSYYADSPLVAANRLVIALRFGSNVEE
ncbi:MAG: hypothetical protein COA99_04500 [Moraxellaceae bacterium]|nr:MAG: hypothetical protein COA99_04500 [Moraxellaceae bacterium]